MRGSHQWADQVRGSSPPSLIRASCPEYIHLFLYTERLKSGQREENSVILVGSHGVIIFYSVFVNVLAVWSTMCHMYHVLFILFYWLSMFVDVLAVWSTMCHMYHVLFILFYWLSMFVDVLAVWSTMCHMYHVLFILFYWLSMFVDVLAVWSTMCHMYTMHCLPTSTVTMWAFQVLRSKFYELLKAALVAPSLLSSSMFIVWDGFFCFRYFKESSEEEREHAEKFMKYQVYWDWPSSC